MRVFGIILGLMLGVLGGVAKAQEQGIWVQIDKQPTLSAAMDRARAYGALLDQVQGYRLPTGAYAVVVGPMASDAAVATLQSLLAQNMIAADSALADGSAFGAQFWPVGAQAVAPVAQAPDQADVGQTPVVLVPADQAVLAQQAPEQPALEDMPAYQSLGDAQAAEVGLSDSDRREVQMALKWFGLYAGLVDGNIGSGSRAGMATWQSIRGFDPTGVLTTGQRAVLIESYRAEEAGFGMETINDLASGIEISLPMAMLAYESTTPPFVRFGAKDGSGVTALLISQPGGTKANLSALYDVLQSLDIMPVIGDRALEEGAFTLQGRNDQIETLAYGKIVDGAVKGYVLSWQVAQGGQMPRVVEMMRSSFRSTGQVALDSSLVPLSDAAKQGLLAGLAVKEPRLSRSGFFVDPSGLVLTTIEAVERCGTITLDQSHGATVTFADKASGLAVLRPDTAIAPRSVASFATSAPQVGSDIAVSGYSYGARLPAPVLTQGTLVEAQGLNGEKGLSRLTLQAMPGDAGGAVLDEAGAVVGMLLPAQAKGGKDLPAGVAFAVTAKEIAGVLTNPQGPALTLASATGQAAPTRDALHAAMRDMTVLVSCWE